MESLNRGYLPYVILIAILSIGVELFFSRSRRLVNYDRQESYISATIFLPELYSIAYFD